MKTAYFAEVVSKLWVLIDYKPRWGLTYWGWLLLLSTIASSIILIITRLHSFLAYTAPIKADALVVEGWLGDDGLTEAIAEFNRGNYRLIITTGVTVPRGIYISKYKNFAQFSAATLVKLGFDEDKIAVVSAPAAKRDRTLSSAYALRQWLLNCDTNIKSINLYSYDVHTRRSWLIFKRVLNPNIKVGAIAAHNNAYDTESWWNSSQGVRSVISETIGYLYAKFIKWNA